MNFSNQVEFILIHFHFFVNYRRNGSISNRNHSYSLYNSVCYEYFVIEICVWQKCRYQSEFNLVNEFDGRHFGSAWFILRLARISRSKYNGRVSTCSIDMPCILLYSICQRSTSIFRWICWESYTEKVLLHNALLAHNYQLASGIHNYKNATAIDWPDWSWMVILVYGCNVCTNVTFRKIICWWPK